MNTSPEQENSRGPSWRFAGFRTPVERLVEAVLSYSAAPDGPPRRLRAVVEKVIDFIPVSTRVVILGGGTGLSTVVGGNSQMPDWPDHPFIGLKQEFPNLDVVVCTTDDGGSTGRLLQCFPMIGIGDLRKSCLSLMRPDRIRESYGATGMEARHVVRAVQRIFNYRFNERARHRDPLRDPVEVLPPAQRQHCPASLAESFRSLTAPLADPDSPLAIDPRGHALGNLILTAAIFEAAGGQRDRAPGLTAINSGLDRIAHLIGTPAGRLHAATSTPGELKFRYANGVEVYGQSKSAAAHRRCPVERVAAEFVSPPSVSTTVLRAIREADLIIYAPGSLYTSIIPILQIPQITAAIRENTSALKILGANSWIQQGETDMSLRNEGRGFLVSELIEAYDRNVPGGAEGMFSVVLSANLEQIPSNILRNYALEGKSPIHLDRGRVEGMGYQPIEASLLSPDYVQLALVIHHDARKFALAVRTLLWAHQNMEPARPAAPKRLRKRAGEALAPAQCVGRRRRPLCDHLTAIRQELGGKSFRRDALRRVMLQLAWENRDLRPAHLTGFRGVRVVGAAEWHRATAWDNVLGYYDPEDRFVKVHERDLDNPAKLREDLLIALGESLLGRYIESRRWLADEALARCGARCFEIQLRPTAERECYLNDFQLRAYLGLARMTHDAQDPLVYRIVLNNDEGFLPPGILFGLVFAWYLNNSYGAVMEYEMSLLRFPGDMLIPHQVKERARKQALVAFFREVVFGHTDRGRDTKG